MSYNGLSYNGLRYNGLSYSTMAAQNGEPVIIDSSITESGIMELSTT